MAVYITTYNHHHINPLDPDMDKVKIEDIAHALSLLSRGNGHVKTFFSVGAHCVWCAREAQARGYPVRVQLALLLHDGSEAYFADVPSPVKHELPAYMEAENNFLEKLYTKYLGSPLTSEEDALVDRVDHELLKWDMYTLLGEGSEEDLPALLVPADYGWARNFEEVEQTYKDLFDILTKSL